MRFSLTLAALFALSGLACGSASNAEADPVGEPAQTTHDGGPTSVIVPVPEMAVGKPCDIAECPEGYACQNGAGVALCFAPPPPASEPAKDEAPSADKPECATDADCAIHDDACLTSWCGNGFCFAKERDDDGDGRSLCGGGEPGSYDCDDHDGTIYPGAVELCGDGIDNDCDGLVDDKCYEFCDTFGGPQNEGKRWERGCCATPAGAFPGIFLDGLKKPAPTHTDLFKAAGSPFVYYLAIDGKRYVFPLAAHLASWFGKTDANGVPSLDASVCGFVTEYPEWTVAAIPPGGNIGFRPGTFVTGIESDPKRYIAWPNSAWATEAGCNGVLRQLLPEVASDLFPAGTTARTILTPDAFFASYGIGAQMAHNEPGAPALNPPEAGGIDQYLGLAPWGGQ
jgi:hypothetical protein